MIAINNCVKMMKYFMSKTKKKTMATCSRCLCEQNMARLSFALLELALGRSGGEGGGV